MHAEYNNANTIILVKYVRVTKFIGSIFQKAISNGVLDVNQMKTLIKLYKKLIDINSEAQACLFEFCERLNNDYYLKAMQSVLNCHNFAEKMLKAFNYHVELDTTMTYFPDDDKFRSEIAEFPRTPKIIAIAMISISDENGDTHASDTQFQNDTMENAMKILEKLEKHFDDEITKTQWEKFTEDLEKSGVPVFRF